MCGREIICLWGPGDLGDQSPKTDEVMSDVGGKKNEQPCHCQTDLNDSVDLSTVLNF